MFKDIKLLLGIAGLLAACAPSNKKALQIDFSADSSKIVFSQIEPVGLAQIKHNLSTDSDYQKLAWVLQTPGDNDSTAMELEWPGKLELQGDDVVFKPDTPFRKGKLYLVETMLNTDFATKKDVLHAEVGHNVKPVQKILTR